MALAIEFAQLRRATLWYRYFFSLWGGGADLDFNGSVSDFCSVDWGLCLDLFFGEFRGTTVDLFPRFLRFALGISNEVFFWGGSKDIVPKVGGG